MSAMRHDLLGKQLELLTQMVPTASRIAVLTNPANPAIGIRSLGADLARAAPLYAKACEAGDPWGCNDLGVLCARGTGVPKDTARAADLLSRACAAGLPDGCNNEYFLRSSSEAGFPGLTSRAHTR